MEPAVSLPSHTISSEPTVRRGWTPLQQFGRQVPEFGGAFVDQNAVLTIHLTDLSAVPRATEEIRRELRAQRREHQPLRFVKGDYSYRQLESFYRLLRPFLGQPGVSRVGVDERDNRLRIGVVGGDVRTRVENGIAALALPPAAFVIEEIDYATITAIRNLTDQVRPLLSGLQVSVQIPRAGSRSGTLAAIVQWNGVSYGLISSHIADPAGLGRVGHPVYQNSTGARIGDVAINPAFSVSSPQCPVNARCRFSDAALVALDPSVSTSLGFVARPLSGPGPQPGSLQFDDANLIELLSDGINCYNGQGCMVDWWPGDSASKIGMVTGWTGGAIATTWLEVTGLDGLTRLDVFGVFGAGSLGDSGAPVLDATRTRIAGVQFGVSTYQSQPIFLFSWWPRVATELAGAENRLHAIPPQMLGYEARWLRPPGCEWNPDAMTMYLIFGYPDGQGAYETRQAQYMGTTPYTCGGYFPGDYQQSTGYGNCIAKFNGDCPCAFNTVGGGSCPVLEP